MDVPIMNTFAYDKGLPCLNPSCKSHGRSHPNCRCYGYAKGGEIERFCSGTRAHQPECEYYMASGGEIDESQLQNIQPPDEIDESQLQSISAPSQIDESQLENVKPPQSKYEEPGQQIITGVEGAAQGLAGPLATYAETHLLGVKPEDIKGRAEANPWIHGTAEVAGLGAGLVSGVGEAGLIAKGAGAISEAANISKLGSMALKGALEAAAYTGGDEISKAMLAEPGSDPEKPASAALLHIGAAGLMGAVTGGIFSLGEDLIGKMSDKISQKMAEKGEAFLVKMGESKEPLKDLGISGKIAEAAALPLAYKTGSAVPIAFPKIKQFIEKNINEIVGTRANPYIQDAAIKALLKNESSGLPNAVHYANQISSGVKKAVSGVGALFSPGISQITPPVSDKIKEKLNEFIEQGQVQQQLLNSNSSPYAEGGMVSEPNNSFSTIFPEQNTILNQAKGRISTYLNGIRPTAHSPKLAFDDEPPQIEKKRIYDRALELAVSPLSILNHVNKGDLTPEHMQHMKGLYPEVHRYLSGEMTKQITEAQLDGKKPPYHKQQAMSLFLGTELEGTMTPQAIATIQGLYATKNAQQQAPQKTKKGTAPLSKASGQYLTDEQAREQRQQNAKS